MDEYIRFEGITKQFPGQTALKDVSFPIRRGEVHALLGENGAGKSTLLNILHGIFPATAGTVSIAGEPVHFQSANEAINAGIAKVHQEINLVLDMTVAENLLMGSAPKRGLLLDRKEMRRATQAVLDRLGCAFSPETPVRDLNMGNKQMLQIAKALHHDAKVISFDEPTSSLSHAEVQTLFSIIRELKSQGITVIYISHKLDEIFEICDCATVLRDGQYQGTFPLADVNKEDLIRRMVGRDVSMFTRRAMESAANYDTPILEAHNVSVLGDKGIDFTLYQGEILGFFGLVGAQRSETIGGIFGSRPLTGGSVTLHGTKMRLGTPRRAIDSGVAMVPENRKEHGFIADLTNGENISLASLKRFRRGIFQNFRKRNSNAIDVGKRVGLQPNRPDFMTCNLSGGNQQKVILAKWLTTDTDILIVDEPTKGIDVGAKAEIYLLMEKMVHAGKTIIMISSELIEIMGIADRVIVLREGQITGVFTRDQFSENDILFAAMEGVPQ